jgi:hypothetical protein
MMADETSDREEPQTSLPATFAWILLGRRQGLLPQ